MSYQTWSLLNCFSLIVCLSLHPHYVDGQVVEMAECMGSALLHRGHSKSKNPYIGIFSQNRPEVSSAHVNQPLPIVCVCVCL